MKPWLKTKLSQAKYPFLFLTQLVKCRCIVRRTPVPASLHLLLLNAFADQGFVFLTIPTSATLCRHCCSSHVVKICGSSTKQLLYFGAGLHKLLLGEEADVELGCSQSWAWCLLGLSVMLFAHLMPALVWLYSADTATLQELRSSNAGLELIHFLGSCNSHNVWNDHD